MPARFSSSGRLERHVDMVVPRLGDEADRVGLRVEQAPRLPGSLEAERPARLVMPKAVNFAFCVRFSEKNAVSSGLAPG